MTIGSGDVPALKSNAAKAIAFSMATKSTEWRDSTYRKAYREHLADNQPTAGYTHI